MKQERRIEPAAARPVRGFGHVALVGTPVVFAVYALALGVARDLSLLDAIVAGIANTLPTMVFALAAYRIVTRWLIGRGFAAQAAGHVLLAALYAVLTYWLLLVMLGAMFGASLLHFSVEPFSVRGSAWQLLQNVTVYGIVAALAYLHARPEPVTLILADPGVDEGPRPTTRYFIRSGDDIHPIDVDTIVSIVGADDYAEVATLTGRHLVRMTLAEFEKALDPALFIRVHRSRIVNLERIARAEPAGGGRMLLHMEDGEAIPASRTGARLLRDRMI